MTHAVMYATASAGGSNPVSRWNGDVCLDTLPNRSRYKRTLPPRVYR
jgi:hypothetical protein